MFLRLKQWTKWLLKIAVVAVPLLFIVSFIFIEYSSRPEFCQSCHFMQVYYNSWKASKHKDVKCSECHYPPGAEGFVVSKTQALSSVVTYFTKTHGTKPWAEIGDKSCLKQGCHSEQIIKGRRVFKGVVFDHGSHLTQLRRGKQLRCVSCHSQMVQGEHITATESTCFLCHFKDLPESRYPVALPVMALRWKLSSFEVFKRRETETCTREDACLRDELYAVSPQRNELPEMSQRAADGGSLSEGCD